MSEQMSAINVTTAYFKGPSGHIDLDRNAIFVGPNGTGKTRYLRAVAYVISGTAGDGKTAADNGRFFGPNGGHVGLTFSDGFSFTRSLSKEGGKNTETVNIASQRGVSGVNKAQSIIDRRCGDFAPMFNAAEFLGLSPDKKRDLLLDLCAKVAKGGEKPDANGIESSLRMRYLELRPDVGKQAVKAYLDAKPETDAGGLCGYFLDESERDHLASFCIEVHKAIKGDIGEAVAAAIEQGSQLVSVARADHDAAVEAGRELSARKNQIVVKAGHIAEVNTEREQSLKEKEATAAKLAEAEERAKTREKIEGDIRKIMYDTGMLGPLDESIVKPHERMIAEFTTKETEHRAARVTKLAALQKQQIVINELSAKADPERIAAAERELARAEAAQKENRLTTPTAHEWAGKSVAELREEAKLVHEEGEALDCEKMAKRITGMQGELSKAKADWDRIDLERVATHELLRALESKLNGVKFNLAAAKGGPWGRLNDALKRLMTSVQPSTNETSSIIDEISAIVEAQVADIPKLEERVVEWTKVYEDGVAARDSADKAVQAQQVIFGAKQDAVEVANIEYNEAITKKSALAVRYHNLVAYADWRDRSEAAARATLSAKNDLHTAKLAQGDSANGLTLVRSKATELTTEAESLLAEANKCAAQASQLRQDVLTAKNNAEKLASLTARKVELEKRLAEVDATAGTVDLTMLRGRLEDLKNKLAELDAELDAKTRFDAVDRELAICTENAKKRELQHDVYKRGVSALKAVRETMMATLVAPVVDRMTEFLEAVGIPAKAFFELDNATGKKTIFELGWIINGETRVCFESMSGGQRVIFIAALIRALVLLADPPFKFLPIEAAECDPENLHNLIRACEKTCGEFGNVFIATCFTPAEAVTENWQIVDMAKVVA